MRSRVLAEVLALVAPPACAACRTALEAATETLCPACRRALPWLTAPRCPRCALPLPCAPCPARRAAFAGAWAPLAHEGPARSLVNALKFGGAQALADLMGAQVAAGAPDWLAPGTPLVPVPAHPASRRSRGFDQAQRLAGALGRRADCPVQLCLRRHGPDVRQLGASRRRRTAARRLEFAATGPVPARAILVDDVHTTGATLDACARALRDAGASRVLALTYSRTLKG
jgi:predicted amidophosphoribosyltransferase